MTAIVAKRKTPGPRIRLRVILASLDDDKAEDVSVIGLKGKSSLADQIVVASGRSQRHVATLAEHVSERLKAQGVPRVPIEGLRLSEWVVVDAGDIIVHLFQPEARAHYGIEKMWSLTKPKAQSGAKPEAKARGAPKAKAGATQGTKPAPTSRARRRSRGP